MSDNPYLRRKNKEGIGSAGRKSETRLTKKLGGRARPASGALESAKGDIVKGEFLIEAKSTQADSFSIQLTHLAKIKAEAMSHDKTPALTVDFTTGNGKPKRYGSWVLIEQSEFDSYMHWKENIEE